MEYAHRTFASSVRANGSVLSLPSETRSGSSKEGMFARRKSEAANGDFASLRGINRAQTEHSLDVAAQNRQFC